MTLATLATLLPLVLPQVGPTGTVPDRTYAPGEVFQQISPTLSPGVHHNQPHVVDGRLFLSGNGRQEIWDIADPYAPVRLSVLQSPHAAGEAEGHQVSFARLPDGHGGYRLHAATISGRGIDLWDITDPLAPTLAHALELQGIQYGDNTQAVWGVAWQGRYIYVGGTNTGLHIVDAVDPQQPVVVGRLTTAELGGISAGPVFALGNLLVVSTPKGASGITTLDCSDPLHPTLLDTERPITGGSYIGWFYGRHVYLQTPLRVFDVLTDPTNIALVGTRQTPLSEYMNFGDDRLFLGSLRAIAGGVGGVQVYDVSNPAAPTLTGHVPARNDPRTDDQFSVPIGNLLAVSDDEANGLRGSFLAPLASERDRTPPRVLYVDPPDGAIGRAVTSRIGFSFSDQIELATLDPSTVIVRPVLGGPALTGSFGVVHTVASFTPDAPLAPNTAYEIVLPTGGVRDLVGNGLVEAFRATFRTGSAAPPGGLSIQAPPPTLVGAGAAFSVGQTNPQLAYEWDFGDGSPRATGPSVTHSFQEAGRYSVRVSSSVFVAAATEAEHAARSGGVTVGASLAGFRGTGYAEFPSAAQGSGVKLTWTAEAASAGVYRARVRYLNSAAATRRLRLRVNGVSTLLYLSPTGSAVWSEVAVNVQLRVGTNDLDLLADVGTVGAVIDQCVLEGLSAVTAEAEALQLSARVSVANTVPGFRGTGYAVFPSSQGPQVRLELPHTTASGGSHVLRVRYAAHTPRRLGVYVNGVRRDELVLPEVAQGWGLIAANVPLEPGNNLLALAADAGTPGPLVDQVTLDAPPPVTNASVTHIVHRPLTLSQPTRSSGLVLHGGSQRAFVVNPDSDTVAAIDTATHAVVYEVPVGDHPVALALYQPAFGAAELWVTNKASASISVLDALGGAQLAAIALPFGSQPHGIVATPDGSALLVALEATGEVLRLDPASRAVTHRRALGAGDRPRLRALAVTADSRTLLAPRFVSRGARAEVYALDPLDLALRPTLELALDPGPDTPDTGRGLPNHLAGVTVGPDGMFAWLPGIKANIQRGGYRDGLPLTHDSTVRPLLARIELATAQERAGDRVDLNDADSPVAVESSRLGDIVFVALQGLNQVDVRDVRTGEALSSLPTGRAPGALALDGQGRLWVQDALSRTVTVFEVASILDGSDTTGSVTASVVTSARERLAPEVLRGKQVFHDAADPRMAFEGYLSCASCHVDGTDDGQVWDFTDRGEGFRNTATLQGRSGMGHGPVHWSANFDEIQDFEHDIRAAFGGTGFLPDAVFNQGTRNQPLGDPKAGLDPDLDALALYVASLRAVPASPFRAQDGTLTPEAAVGRALFLSLDCRNCHSGPTATDSGNAPLHDVGTLAPHSGRRSGQPLTGIDTPTLKGAWATAPYFHDGSAATLEDTLLRPGHGSAQGLPASARAALVAYLAQIDETVDPLQTPRIALGASDARLLGGAALIPLRSERDSFGFELPAGDASATLRFRVALESAVTRTVRVDGRPRGGERLELWVDGALVSPPIGPGTPPPRGALLTVPAVVLRAGVNVIEVRQTSGGAVARGIGISIE